MDGQALLPAHGVQFIDAYRVTGADDGRKIAGFVQLFSEHRQVRLAVCQYAVDFLPAQVGHEGESAPGLPETGQALPGGAP